MEVDICETPYKSLINFPVTAGVRIYGITQKYQLPLYVFCPTPIITEIR